MEVAGNNLTLNVDTSGARYPVTLDPLFSTVTTLPEPIIASGDAFGVSVAISADGTTALIGASGTIVNGYSGSGQAYVFTAVNGSWSSTPVATIPDPLQQADDYFGASVALSSDGTTALIGAYNTQIASWEGNGQAYVFTAVNGSWSSTPVATIPDPLASVQGDDHFGNSVTLSADGTTALIGAPATMVNSKVTVGQAYVFTAVNGNWSSAPVATLFDPGYGPASIFGSSVALSADGTIALIGAPGTADVGGVAYIFSAVNGNWSSTPVATIPDPLTEFQGGGGFGNSVELSADGATALIGAPGTTVNGNNYVGQAYVFTAVNGNWSSTPVATIPDPLLQADDYFGTSVAISAAGATALIGARGTTVNGGINVGQAYVFTAVNGNWSSTPLATLSDPIGAANDQFGNSVALPADGTAALIGAWATTVNSNTAAGLTYVFASPVDLSLALSSTPGTVTVGGGVTYMLTISNNDTAITARNLTLTDTLPTEMRYVSSNPAGGACNNATGTVTCTLTTLAPQGTWQPSITVTATAVGNAQNSATVSASQPDPNSANNNAGTSTTVNTGTSGGGSGGSSSGGGGGATSPPTLTVLVLVALVALRRRTIGVALGKRPDPVLCM